MLTAKDGRPKPSGPWLAAMMVRPQRGSPPPLAAKMRFLHQYWAASNPKVDVGVSVKPAKRESLLEARPAEFCVQQLGRHYHGAAVAGLLREAMKLSGVDLKLPGWCAPLPLSPACFLP